MANISVDGLDQAEPWIIILVKTPIPLFIVLIHIVVGDKSTGC